MSTPKFSKEELDWLYKNKIFSLKDFMQKVREAKILVIDEPPNCPNSSSADKIIIKKDLNDDNLNFYK